MTKSKAAPRKLSLSLLWKVFGTAFFVYLFFGFMLLPCLNTLTQIFNANPDDPLAVIKFFFAGKMPSFVLFSPADTYSQNSTVDQVALWIGLGCELIGFHWMISFFT